MIIGVQLVAFAFFTKVFAISEGLLPEDPRFSRLFRYFFPRKGLVVGACVFLFGLATLLWAVVKWQQTGFGMLPFAENLRRVVTASTLIVIGLQGIFSSFFLSILGLKTTTRNPP